MRAVSHLLMVLLVVVCSMVSLCTAAPSLEPWHQSINATVFQITKLLSTGTGPAEQMLVSCGAGCYGHQSYVAFAVLDTVSGRLQSSFAHCNAADWYPNTNPICAGRNGEFSLITHLNATGAQVALTSVTQEPECQGTLIQFPPNIAYLYNTPCTAGKMLVFAPIQSQLNGAMTYTYQVDVVAGTVMNVTIPDIAGFTVFSISTDNGGNMDPILVVGMPGSTGIVNLNLFSVTQGLLLSMPYALVDGVSPAFVWQDTMAYVVVPVQASPAQLFAIDTVAGRPVWNKTLAAIDAASTWLGPFWSDDCGAVVVNGKAICYSSAGAVVWISQYLGVTTTAAVHPTSGAILVGVTGEGLIALNPFTGSRMWREAPSITLTNITGPLLFVQNNAMAVTQRYLGSGIMELVGVPLNITTPTAAPPTPVPPTTTTTPTPTMP